MLINFIIFIKEVELSKINGDLSISIFFEFSGLLEQGFSLREATLRSYGARDLNKLFRIIDS